MRGPSIMRAQKDQHTLRHELEIPIMSIEATDAVEEFLIACNCGSDGVVVHGDGLGVCGLEMMMMMRVSRIVQVDFVGLVLFAEEKNEIELFAFRDVVFETDDVVLQAYGEVHAGG